MAATAAMGNAKRNPITTTAIKAIMMKTIASHQNESTGERATCKENIDKTPNRLTFPFLIFISEARCLVLLLCVEVCLVKWPCPVVP